MVALSGDAGAARLQMQQDTSGVRGLAFVRRYFRERTLRLNAEEFGTFEAAVAQGPLKGGVVRTNMSGAEGFRDNSIPAGERLRAPYCGSLQYSCFGQVAPKRPPMGGTDIL